jgi:hypothetical protein
MKVVIICNKAASSWEICSSGLLPSYYYYYYYYCPRPLKMGPLGCPETSVINDHYSLRNNPEERSSQPLRSGRLKSQFLHAGYCWLLFCKKRLQVPAESRTVRPHDSLPRSPCDITSQSTVLVCTELVLNRQHCPSQSTSRFYADDFPLRLYHTFVQVL